MVITVGSCGDYRGCPWMIVAVRYPRSSAVSHGCPRKPLVKCDGYLWAPTVTSRHGHPRWSSWTPTDNHGNPSRPDAGREARSDPWGPVVYLSPFAATHRLCPWVPVGGPWVSVGVRGLNSSGPPSADTSESVSLKITLPNPCGIVAPLPQPTVCTHPWLINASWGIFACKGCLAFSLIPIVYTCHRQSRRIRSDHLPIPNTTAALHTGPSPLCSALPTPSTPRHEGSVPCARENQSQCGGGFGYRVGDQCLRQRGRASEPRHNRRRRAATNGFRLSSANSKPGE